MNIFIKLLGILAIGAVALVIAVALGLRNLPNVKFLKGQYPTVLYRPENEKVSVQLVKKRPPQWISLSQISPYAVGAFVVSEDWGFFSHTGVDIGEIRKMLEDHFEEGEPLRGASTITQQVAKNVFLSRERTLSRTFMEKNFSKKEILEIYFNIVELGNGVFGIAPAARTYFDKTPADLNPKEAAFLAMLLPNPKKYSQSFQNKELTPYAQRTINRILEKMEKGGYLSERELALTREIPLSFEIPPPAPEENFGEEQPPDENLEEAPPPPESPVDQISI
jgi:monofunctional biosynthetic peptidoglycan transglycosylase